MHEMTEEEDAPRALARERPGLLDGYLDQETLARELNVTSRTIRRYTAQPDGLPYSEIGGRTLSHERMDPERLEELRGVALAEPVDVDPHAAFAAGGRTQRFFDGDFSRTVLGADPGARHAGAPGPAVGAPGEAGAGAAWRPASIAMRHVMAWIDTVSSSRRA